MISIVGGVYREICMRPCWREVYGSAGRAASAIARMGAPAELHSYFDPSSLDVFENRAALEEISLYPTSIAKSAGFFYHHGLESPLIEPAEGPIPPLHLEAEQVISFGLIEGNAVVKADYAVYDPQNVVAPKPFNQNGSSATHLALVLNQYEAGVMSGLFSANPEELAIALAAQQRAEVVVIKRGPLGCLVYDGDSFSTAPAYRTNNVWKIGSGDTFVAHFGYQWMHANRSPADAAMLASKATAYYCQTMGVPSLRNLDQFTAPPITPSARYVAGKKFRVYLAGPFFSLAQLWMIEQARNNLRDLGLHVFSPYHDVGHGSADDVVQQDLDGIDNSDLVFAIGDGLDSGTIYEIGYARARGKPVIMYSENESEEDKKMMEGSGCINCSDYVTAIYQALWTAVEM